MEVALTTFGGQLTVSGTTGLVFSIGDGIGDDTMVFRGTRTAINTALDGLGFTTNPGFVGAATITITTNDLGGTDVGGALTDTDTLTITVTGNTAPVISGPVSGTGEEDAGQTFAVADLLAVASDVDGDTLSVIAVGQAGHGTVAFDATAETVTYTPEADYSGADSFTYTVADGQGGEAMGTVDLTVMPVNDVPVVSEGVSVSGAEDTSVNGTLMASDIDNDPLTFALGEGPTSGTATVNGDGTWSYTPEADYSGEDTFTYTVSDGQGGEAMGTVNVTVTPVVDAPVLNGPSTLSGQAGQALALAGLAAGADRHRRLGNPGAGHHRRRAAGGNPFRRVDHRHGAGSGSVGGRRGVPGQHNYDGFPVASQCDGAERWRLRGDVAVLGPGRRIQWRLWPALCRRWHGGGRGVSGQHAYDGLYVCPQCDGAERWRLCGDVDLLLWPGRQQLWCL
ncbi:MAG: putative hemolysin [Rhodospirillaceae bacterium]|nr:MAG: putative hemolysin [Rhodospirillaceae bacterium]